MVAVAVVVAALAVAVAPVCPSEVSAIMKDYTLGFGQALDKCREEVQLTTEMIEEFIHLWQKDFKFEHRELGCAIICMARHFNLVDEDNRMHHENTIKFLNEQHPNGALVSRETVNLIHECEQRTEGEPDHCWRVLRVAECFKTVCLQYGLAPNLDVVVAELIMETKE